MAQGAGRALQVGHDGAGSGRLGWVFHGCVPPEMNGVGIVLISHHAPKATVLTGAPGREKGCGWKMTEIFRVPLPPVLSKAGAAEKTPAAVAVKGGFLSFDRGFPGESP